jgi:hypothetical protein
MRLIAARIRQQGPGHAMAMISESKHLKVTTMILEHVLDLEPKARTVTNCFLLVNGSDTFTFAFAYPCANIECIVTASSTEEVNFAISMIINWHELHKY